MSLEKHIFGPYKSKLILRKVKVKFELNILLYTSEWGKIKNIETIEKLNSYNVLVLVITTA